MSSIKKNFIDKNNSPIIIILFKMKKYSETEKIFRYKFSVNFKFIINVILVNKNNILLQPNNMILNSEKFLNILFL